MLHCGGKLIRLCMLSTAATAVCIFFAIKQLLSVWLIQRGQNLSKQLFACCQVGLLLDQKVCFTVSKRIKKKKSKQN